MLTNIDLTGAQFSLKYYNGQEKKKTQFGGIMTLTIYSVSLAYAIYIIILWLKGGILPKVSSSLVAQPELQIEIPSNPSFYPFKKEDNLLIPLVLQYSQGQLLKVDPLFPTTESEELKNELNLKNITIKRTEQQKDLTIIFILTRCESSYNYGQTCANESYWNEFYGNITNFMTIVVYTQQYNQKENRFDQASKQSILVLDPINIIYNQIQLKTTQNQHDTGILFENYGYQTHIYDREILSQTTTSEFANSFFKGFEPLFITSVSVDPLQSVVIITDPKIGEVLAQIGAIISILMALQLISSTYNQHLLENELVQLILNCLYPNIKEVEINKNILGRISSVNYKQSTINNQYFIQKYDKATKNAQSYLNIFTIISKLIQMERYCQLSSFKIDNSQDMPQEQKIKIQPISSVQEDNEEQKKLQNSSDISIIFRDT